MYPNILLMKVWCILTPINPSMNIIEQEIKYFTCVSKKFLIYKKMKYVTSILDFKKKIELNK